MVQPHCRITAVPLTHAASWLPSSRRTKEEFTQEDLCNLECALDSQDKIFCTSLVLFLRVLDTDNIFSADDWWYWTHTHTQNHYCMPISFAYCTHCAPPQNVLPKRMRKIRTDLRAPFFTKASCMAPSRIKSQPGFCATALQ